MFEEKSTIKNRRPLIIAIIAVLLIGIAIAVYFIFFNKPVANTNNNVATTTVSDFILPDYSIGTSSKAWEDIKVKLDTWANDAKIKTYSGLGSSLIVEGRATRYGSDRGSFTVWTGTAYSASKNATVDVIWRSGEASFREETKVDDFLKKLYSPDKIFNVIPTVVDSEAIYTKVIEKGLNITDNYYQMFLKYDTDGVLKWSVEERSRTNLDAYGNGRLIKTYFFNAVNGNFIEKK